MVLDDIEYWHFDAPTLYTVKVSLKKDGELLDQKEKVVGFRDFHIQGRRFFLNGEPVRVCGTEWMPGSDPVYGAAETKEQLEKAGCPILGVVLNKVDMKQNKYYGNKYYNKYYGDYYGKYGHEDK